MAVLQAPIDAVVRIEDDQRFPGDWRVMKGLTQPQLAARPAAHRDAVQRIERGEHHAVGRQRPHPVWTAYL